MRAIEVTLTGGETVTLREPRADEMPVFLRAMPSIQAVAKALEPLGGDVFLPVNLPDNAMDGMYPLIASLAGMNEAQVRGMSMFDYLALVLAFTRLVPRDFFNPTPTSFPS